MTQDPCPWLEEIQDADTYEFLLRGLCPDEPVVPS